MLHCSAFDVHKIQKVHSIMADIRMQDISAEDDKLDDNNNNQTDAEDTERELNEALLTQATKKRENAGLKTGRAAIKILLILFFVLTPGFFIWIAADFPHYNITRIKMGNPVTNSYMEFLRYCVFFALIFILYELVDWAIWCVPTWTDFTLRKLGYPPGKQAQRRLYYLAGAHLWITISVWIITVIITGSWVMYKTNFITTISKGLLGEVPKNAAAAVAAIAPVKNGWFYFERLLLVMVDFFLLQAFGKYLLELIRVNFHRMAFEDRVAEVNFRFQVITKLLVACRSPVQRPSKIKLIEDTRDVRLLPDRLGELATPKRAKEVAIEVFHKLVPSNREYLTIDDLNEYFEHCDLQPAFAVLDQSGSGDPTLDEIISVALEVCKERKVVQNGLDNNNQAIKKLDDIITFCAIFITWTFAIPILELGAAAIMIVFGVLWTAFGYLFRNTAKMVFESLVFVFVEHAFDIGDRVIIDGEYLTVERVEIFTSIFQRWDGTTVYMPNCNLCNKNIYNIRRSATQSDQIDVKLSGNTTIDQVWALRNKLLTFTKSEPKDFMGPVNLADFMADGDKVKLQLMVEYRTNFQDAALRAARRNKFIAMLKEVVADLGLEYSS